MNDEPLMIEFPEPVLTELPSPGTEYVDDDALESFTKMWKGEREPRLRRIWKDSGGGYTTHLWFKDSDGHAHGLYTPPYWKTKDVRLTELMKSVMREPEPV